jgi:hypothetical protein
METRKQFLGVNSIKFNRYFQTDEDCYRYLSEIKWPDNAYQYKRCGYEKHGKGKKPYSRRCIKCKHDESPTVGTIFDKCKFLLLLAFHIAFKISTKKKGISSLELLEEFEFRQKTCWEFKWKIQQAMRSSLRYPLTGTVHVDGFFIGGEEEGVIGKEKGKKRLVIVALEIVPGGVGRAYAENIANASSHSFKPFFERHIDKNAEVIADEWTGYMPLRNEYRNMSQIPSNSGKSFPKLHIHIMNLKLWLRGIHHHCSEKRLQGYLDEFHFRYNRRNNMDTIFDLLMRKMVLMNLKRLCYNENNRAT